MKFVPNIFGFSISGNAVADLVFFLVALVAGIISLILFFHWRRYSLGGKFLALMEVIYLTGTVAFLLIAFYSLN